MERFEKETGKLAIWNGKVTEQFKKWRAGKKIYDSNKDDIRWTAYLKPDQNEKLVNFLTEHNYSKSELIRKSIDFFINCTLKIKDYTDDNSIDNLTISAIEFYFDEMRTSNSEISDDLKQSLTPLKGYLQLTLDIIQENGPEEALNFLNNIKESYDDLENKIKKYFEKPQITKLLTKPKYDILYVEDDYATVQVITTYINKKGYSIKSVKTAREALKELKYHIPKAILLDIGLPGDISGDSLCKKLRSKKDYKDIPIGYITAKSQETVEKLKKDTKIDFIIRKPFEIPELDVLFKFIN